MMMKPEVLREIEAAFAEGLQLAARANLTKPADVAAAIRAKLYEAGYRIVARPGHTPRCTSASGMLRCDRPYGHGGAAHGANLPTGGRSSWRDGEALPPRRP